jgi:glutamate-ammonia-ligase adenylyltransferase
MGKLGARELNFSSDIDLIYVYSHDGQTSGARPLDHFTYYAKLSEAVTESIAMATEDGIVFRVDLNLRPDGRSGPIVNSVRAAELYYQSYGRSWERNAMLKARSGSGDIAVGDELLKLLEPFIWRRSLDLDVVGEIKAMKDRIDARAGAEGRSDLKLGRGGIREAEFFVSALQLLHGGRPGQEALRERAVLPALERLLYAGIVPANDRDALADAYLFLRRAEHRVQMVDGAQTHRLPPPEERISLARAMGYASVAEFEAALAGHRERVAALFSDLLGRGEDRPPIDPELALILDPQVERERRAEIATRPSRRSTPWGGAGPPSPPRAIRRPRSRWSPRRSRPPTRTRRSPTSPTSRPRCRPRSPTSSSLGSVAGWRACSSPCSAPPTSSRSASSATRR